MWHLEENCKTRELRIWKPRIDSNTVIEINVELFMKSIERYELIYFMDCIWACLVLYICMTCCRWHDRIPSTFRLYLLSIVAHPIPSFPVYINVGPLLHLERALLQFDVQRSIGLRRYISCSSRLLWFVYTTCHISFTYSLFTVVFGL